MNRDPATIGVREAAQLLNVHENTVRNWAKVGILVDARPPKALQLRLSREQVEQIAAAPGPLPYTPDVANAYGEGYRRGRADALKEVRKLIGAIR